jgi:hypothetical protein
VVLARHSSAGKMALSTKEHLKIKLVFEVTMAVSLMFVHFLSLYFFAKQPVLKQF